MDKTTGKEEPAGKDEPMDKGRRAFLTSTALLAGAVSIKAQEKKIDGGLALLIDKKEPERTKRVVPFGAVSLKNIYEHCTACGLCIAACPNEVLRPSSDLKHLMMPYMSFEKGYCRPECTKCSQVCPTGAILPITPEEKTAIHIGIASVDYELCVVNTDGVNCGNCARHCPAAAIHMVAKDPGDTGSLKIPSVDTELCIGCGACENLCPTKNLFKRCGRICPHGSPRPAQGRIFTGRKGRLQRHLPNRTGRTFTLNCDCRKFERRQINLPPLLEQHTLRGVSFEYQREPADIRRISC
jgi:ferredoxin